VVPTWRQNEILFVRASWLPKVSIDSIRDQGQLAVRDAEPLVGGFQVAPGVEDHTIDVMLSPQKLEEWFLRPCQQLVADHDVPCACSSHAHGESKWDAKMLAIRKHRLVPIQYTHRGRDMT